MMVITTVQYTLYTATYLANHGDQHRLDGAKNSIHHKISNSQDLQSPWKDPLGNTLNRARHSINYQDWSPFDEIL